MSETFIETIKMQNEAILQLNKQIELLIKAVKFQEERISILESRKEIAA